jgi:allantoate deiminase/N-carbamoyl-L-amino-acid hydrolase
MSYVIPLDLDRVGRAQAYGKRILAMADALASHSDDSDGLTVTYQTAAHRATAALLLNWMREAGLDAHIDAIGNVVGRYSAISTDWGLTETTPFNPSRVLMTGSHYDTVRNGGRYDGRLGILLPIVVLADMNARGLRLPYDVEVVAFAEEEGVRFKSTFLGSSALAGRFDPAVLDRVDRDGVVMRDLLAADALALISGLGRRRNELLGFLEVHIEQGPVLLDRGLALGVVTSIAGSRRFVATVTGTASHAGTTPMSMRRDAAAAAAEMLLAIERRCSGIAGLVGTVGMLEVPRGATNVIPGRCDFSIDLRADVDATLQKAVDDVLAELDQIARRRNVELALEATLSVPAVPCSRSLMSVVEASVEAVGVPAFRLASGAGHDAMMMANVTDVAMLFVRCGNGGISHNPLETMTADDAGVAALAFAECLDRLEEALVE